MKPPQYIGLDEARTVLSEMGVVLSARQMKRAADKDAEGRRKLPFFIDPIEGTLGLIRLRGHLPKGGYDVPHVRVPAGPPSAPAIH